MLFYTSFLPAFLIDNTRLRVLLRIGSQRRFDRYVRPRLVFSVKLIDIFNEFSVKQVKRDILRTDSRTFAAVRASSCYVKRADNMEQIFFEIIRIRFAGDAGLRIVKYALHAGAGGADISARVAADAAGKLVSPESEAFFCRQMLKIFDVGKAASKLLIRNGLLRFVRFIRKRVVNHMLFTLTGFALFK